MYSECSGLLLLMANTFEMSSVVYANKHCEMTSYTPTAMLLGEPMTGKEELPGSFEGELPKEPGLGYLRTLLRASTLCLPDDLEGEH